MAWNGGNNQIPRSARDDRFPWPVQGRRGHDLDSCTPTLLILSARNNRDPWIYKRAQYVRLLLRADVLKGGPQG